MPYWQSSQLDVTFDRPYIHLVTKNRIVSNDIFVPVDFKEHFSASTITAEV